jgi:hypothetical protein
LYTPRFTLFVAVAILAACGDSRYGIDGQIALNTDQAPQRIAILDSTASAKITRIHELFTVSADSLEKCFRDSLASIDEILAAAEKPIEQASRRLRSSSANYAEAFKLMETYRSFGGNRIFGSVDRKESTATLLEEISDRFYKGKAFSLETGGHIRRTIREKLVPAENRVARARDVLARLKKQRNQWTKTRVEVEGRIAVSRKELVKGFNIRVVDRIEGGVLRETDVDSDGAYRFDKLSAGKYHLYLRPPTPKLVEIQVDGHKHIRISSDAPSPLIDDRT